MNPTAAIRTALVLSLQVPEGTLPLDAELTYDPTDPFAVRLEIGTGEETVTWYFARDLLRDGTTRPTGDGDVRVTPVAGTARPRDRRHPHHPRGLTPPSAPTSPRSSQFLTAAYTLVPTGTETLGTDLDAELAALLG